MITHLRQLSGEIPVRHKADDAQRMRRKIFSICHDIGWETETGEVDKVRLQNWLLKYGYLHKPITEYTVTELPALLTQFENIQKSEYRKWKRR
jgi:hypothetical protein